ncbi:MAG: hypothetical protein PHO37_13285, partial [Kiritimatiellae bacterium]|nr:hypothetical protein [Kiritimatiellia bacterium]
LGKLFFETTRYTKFTKGKRQIRLERQSAEKYGYSATNLCAPCDYTKMQPVCVGRTGGQHFLTPSFLALKFFLAEQQSSRRVSGYKTIQSCIVGIPGIKVFQAISDPTKWG